MSIEVMQEALDKAREEFNRACYLADCGGNAGIRKMNSNKADWLKWVLYLAELGLEYEKNASEPTVVVEEEKPNTDFKKAISFFRMINNKGY